MQASSIKHLHADEVNETDQWQDCLDDPDDIEEEEDSQAEEAD